MTLLRVVIQSKIKKFNKKEIFQFVYNISRR